MSKRKAQLAIAVGSVALWPFLIDQKMLPKVQLPDDE